MMNPVSTSVPQEDGTDRYIIIEPVIEKAGEQGYRSTGVFKIYKDAFGDNTRLVTEPAAIDESNHDQLPDEQNPDYLGKFVFDNGNLRHFKGSVLSLAEQAYLAVFIETYQEPDL